MPRPPRFFISPDQISGSRISISGEDVRHIAAVLRMKSGELLVLCDGQGVEYTVKIVEVGRTVIMTDIVGSSKREPLYPRVVLGQGLPKATKMDFIVQKATELGVSSIVPLVTERTIVKLRDAQKRTARWQKICRKAAMQSNRADIPQIVPIATFRDFILASDYVPLTLNLLPWEEGTQPIKDVLRKHQNVKKIIVLIGPEGGFSAAEAEMATANKFNLVSLGPNILRTETASVAVLSVIGYEYY